MSHRGVEDQFVQGNEGDVEDADAERNGSNPSLSLSTLSLSLSRVSDVYTYVL